MSKAFYHRGLTIESDYSLPKLTIDGRTVEIKKEGGLFVYSERPEVNAKTLDQLGKEIIERSPELNERRETIKQSHLAILKQGVDRWNAWRKENPQVRPLLYDTDLSIEALPDGLKDANLSNAVLIKANLSRQILEGANFHEANLGQANLSHAPLKGANFCRTDLYGTNLSHAKLHGANLQGTQLAMTNFEGAELIECKVYGLSAWDLKLTEATQKDLIILYKKEDVESEFRVENLEVAQFIYLLLNNPKIRNAIDTITSKVVLILGRFTLERKVILDAIRDKLPRHNLVPVLFDFAQLGSKDLTDTVTVLAQMSRFVIVDLTDPSSSPFELKSVYDATKVPIQSIILEGHKPFTMFWDLRAASHDRVLEPFPYRDLGHLMDSLDERIISPSLAAVEMLEEGRQRTARERAAWEEQQGKARKG